MELTVLQVVQDRIAELHREYERIGSEVRHHAEMMEDARFRANVVAFRIEEVESLAKELARVLGQHPDPAPVVEGPTQTAIFRYMEQNKGYRMTRPQAINDMARLGVSTHGSLRETVRRMIEKGSLRVDDDNILTINPESVITGSDERTPAITSGPRNDGDVDLH